MSRRVAPEGFPELARGAGPRIKYAAVYRLHSGTLCCWYGTSARDAALGRKVLEQGTGLIITDCIGVFPVVEVPEGDR